jgi:predicted RecB family endonuclease
VKQIYGSLCSRPFQIIGSASSGLYSAPSTTTGVSAAPATANRLPPPSRGGPSLNVVDPNSASATTTTTTALDSFPELAELSASELRDLMENEEKLLTFLQPHYQSVSEDRINLLDALEVAASENIFKQAQLEERKRTVLERHYTLNGLCRELDELLKRQDDVRQKYDLPLIQDNLKVASLEAEEKGETFADQFLDGKLTVDEFRKNYMASRIQYHHRRAMEDKLAQLIGKQTKKF